MYLIVLKITSINIKNYNQLIKQAKILHNERYIINSDNKSKAMRSLVNQELGKNVRNIKKYTSKLN